MSPGKPKDNKLILVLLLLAALTVASLAFAAWGWPYVQSLLSGGAEAVGSR